MSHEYRVCITLCLFADHFKQFPVKFPNQNIISVRIFTFFKLGFTPCKAEQSLQGMELQEKETQKD